MKLSELLHLEFWVEAAIHCVLKLTCHFAFINKYRSYLKIEFMRTSEREILVL